MTSDPQVFCAKCGYVGDPANHLNCDYNPILVDTKVAERLKAAAEDDTRTKHYDLSSDKQQIVRVLRVLEYTGPREQVEFQISKAIHGQRKVHDVVIRAATIGDYTEILDSIEQCHLLPGQIKDE